MVVTLHFDLCYEHYFWNTNYNAKVYVKMNTKFNVQVNSSGMHEQSIPINALLHSSITLPSYVVITLLDLVEEFDLETFEASGINGLTWEELRDTLLKAITIGAVVGEGRQRPPER